MPVARSTHLSLERGLIALEIVAKSDKPVSRAYTTEKKEIAK